MSGKGSHVYSSLSEADAVREGVEDSFAHLPVIAWKNYQSDASEMTSAKASFRTLWDTINASRGHGWDDNPWVVALTFEVHRFNIDRMVAS